MPDYATILRKTYRPGDKVEASGIYRVTHDKADAHDVTILHGHEFPRCNHCGVHLRYAAVKLAQHIVSNEHFNRGTSPPLP